MATTGRIDQLVLHFCPVVRWEAMVFYLRSTMKQAVLASLHGLIGGSAYSALPHLPLR